MARIRSINPRFWKSLTIAGLSREERLFFIGLWNVADDSGRGLAEPRLMKGELFSLDDDVTAATIETWLKRLSELKLVILYEDEKGRALYQVRSWAEFQRPEKPKESEFSPPGASGRGRGKVGESSGKGRGGVLPGVVSRNRNRNRNGIPASNWPAEAYEIYRSHIGLLAPARFGRALGPAVEEFGWEAVKPWFVAYCTSRPYQKANGTIHGDRPGDKPEDATKDTRWCSPEDFVKNLTFWRERCAPLVQR